MKNSDHENSVRETLKQGWDKIKTGDTEAAINFFRQTLTLNPETSQAWYGLGLALHDQKKIGAAEVCYQQSLQRDPELTAAWNALGDIEIGRQGYSQAIDFYQKALTIAPNSPATRHNLSWAFNNYGNIKQQQGFPQQAATCYRKALELEPEDANHAFNLGLAADESGDFREAEKAYRTAITNDPTMDQAYGNLGNLLRETALLENDSTKLNEAEKLYQKALNINPQNNLIRDNLLRLRYLNLYEAKEAIPSLTKEISTFTDDFLKWRSNLLLSHLLDKVGSYELAFDKADSSHQIISQKQSFNKNDFRAQVDRLINSFSAEILALTPRSNNMSQKPVFIVGMPRSGTTLVEHILSAHPAVEGIGEKPYIGVMAENIAEKIGSANSFPEYITEINRDQLSQLAHEQEERLQEFSLAAKRIINKLPENFLYLGLINLIFPKARIIHCQRRPSDTIISIFLQNFIDPLNFSHKIEDIIFYYHEYLRLMSHWRQVIDLEILEISYEELVQEQEQRSRQLLSFIDLEWNQSCLDFHQQQRLVLTASRDQVKRPIYKSSLARWRNYEKQLSPWLAELNHLNKITGYEETNK